VAANVAVLRLPNEPGELSQWLCYNGYYYYRLVKGFGDTGAQNRVFPIDFNRRPCNSVRTTVLHCDNNNNTNINYDMMGRTHMLVASQILQCSNSDTAVMNSASKIDLSCRLQPQLLASIATVSVTGTHRHDDRSGLSLIMTTMMMTPWHDIRTQNGRRP